MVSDTTLRLQGYCFFVHGGEKVEKTGKCERELSLYYAYS